MQPVLVDPVCDMFVGLGGAITQEYAGVTYYFCEPVCRDTFNDEPERWVPRTPEHDDLVDATTAQGRVG